MQEARLGHLEILKGRIYDTLFLPENMPKNRAYMFAIPLGQYAGRRVKTWEHTNMFHPGSMAAPESFAIREVKCAFYQGGEFVNSDSGLYLGKLELWVPPDLIELVFDPIKLLASDDCKSLIAAPTGPYGEGFLELEDRVRPIIFTLETQHAFSVVLNLSEKPEVPTEFIAVLCGDRVTPVMDS